MFFSVKKWIDRFSEYPNRRQLTKADGTIEQVTVTRDEGTVSKEGDKFNASTMNDLENRISSFDSKVSNQFGTTDDASTASAAYTAGSYIIHNGVRYKVTVAIAKGDAFVEDTNISKATVNEQIADMNTQINSLNDNLAKISMDAVKISAKNNTSDSIKFGVDSSGNYGYIKAGADTVIPFKSQADIDAAYDSGHTNGYTDGYNSGKADARLVLISQTSFGNYETKTINIASGILIWAGDVKKYDCFMKNQSSVTHLINAYAMNQGNNGNPISLQSATDTTVTFNGRYGTISAYQIQ